MEGGDDRNKATGADTTRRRITKAAAASPILASLASPSVWGATCSVSGLQSGNVSGHQHDECKGSGCTPGFWKNHPKLWPGGFIPGYCEGDETIGQSKCKVWLYDGASEIREIMPPGVSVGVFQSTYHYSGDDKIMYILQKEVKNGGNTNSQLAHWIAAVFNSIAGPDFYGTTTEQLMTALLNAGPDYSVTELVAVLTRMNESGACFMPGGNNYDGASCGTIDGLEYFWIVEDGYGRCIPSCPEGQVYKDGEGCISSI